MFDFLDNDDEESAENPFNFKTGAEHLVGKGMPTDDTAYSGYWQGRQKQKMREQERSSLLNPLAAAMPIYKPPMRPVPPKTMSRALPFAIALFMAFCAGNDALCGKPGVQAGLQPFACFK